VTLLLEIALPSSRLFRRDGDFDLLSGVDADQEGFATKVKFPALSLQKTHRRGKVSSGFPRRDDAPDARVNRLAAGHGVELTCRNRDDPLAVHEFQDAIDCIFERRIWLAPSGSVSSGLIAAAVVAFELH